MAIQKSFSQLSRVLWVLSLSAFLYGCGGQPTEDAVVISSFSITGIQGGGDTTSDSFLTSGTIATVHWVNVPEATGYHVTIRNSANTADVCPSQTTSSTSITLSSCSLVDGTSYVANVVALLPETDVNAVNNGYSFLVDATPPESTITAAPSDPSNVVTPSFSFTSSDSASGIYITQCRVDGGAWFNCTSPHVVTPALADAPHTFEVRARDNAGHYDPTPALHAWTVDTNPVGPFDVLGIQGGTDSTSDGFLTDGVNAHVYWSAATSAVNYDVTIRDAADSADVCSLQNTTSTDFNFSGCTLTNGVSYSVRVVARDAVGNTRDATTIPFPFMVDIQDPETQFDAPFVPISDNNTTPTFTFSGTDGESGVQQLECQLDSGGWSVCTNPFTIAAPLAEGPHTFEVRATDNVGRVDGTPATHAWTVDTTDPGAFDVLGIQGGADTTSDNYLADGVNANVFWSASTGATNYNVTIRDAGNTADVCATQNTATTNFDFSACTLTNGTNYTVLVVALDDATNSVNATTYPFSFLVDNVDPDSSIDAPLVPNPDTNTTPTITFSATDGESGVASTECQLNSGGWFACTSPHTISPALTDGPYTFEVRATDNAGRVEATPASHAWVLDTNPPGAFDVLGIQGGTDTTSDGYLTGGVSPHIYWSAATDATNYDVTVRNAADTADECATQNTAATDFDFSSCTLVDGTSYSVRVVAYDAASNPTNATTYPFSFMVDNTDPSSSIDAPLVPDPDSSPTPTFTFSGSDLESGLASLECQLDSGGWFACTSPYVIPAPLGEGPHIFEVRAIDNAGRIDPAPATHAWTITAPAMGAFDVLGVQGGTDTTSDGYLNGGLNPHVYWSASTNATDYDVTVRDAADSADVCATQNTAATDFDFSGCTLVDNTTYNIRVVANDVFSNTLDATTIPFAFVVDNTDPDSSIDAPLVPDPDSDTTPTFTFSGTDAGSGVQYLECQIDSGGWNVCVSPYTVAVPLAQGPHTFEVRAVDNAGRLDLTPALHAWSIDTTGPGAFDVTGIQGGTDTTSDGYLGDGTEANVFWGAATDATNYDVTIRNAADSADVCATQNTASTNFNFTGCALTTGTSYSVRVVAYDAASNPTNATTYPFSFLVDTTDPSGSIDAPFVPDPDTNTTPTFTFSGTDADSGVSHFECSVDGGSYASCTSPHTISPALTSGPHTFDVRVYDNAGNTFNITQYAWTINGAPTAPTGITLLDPAVSPWSDTTPELTVSGVTNGNTVNIYTDSSCSSSVVGTGVAGGTSINITLSPPLTAGTYDFYATQDDGTESTCSTATVQYELITTPPAAPNSLSLFNPVTTPEADDTPEIQIGGVSSGYSVALFTDGTCSTQVGSGTATGSTINITSSALPGDGAYTFYAESTYAGLASGCSTASVAYTYDSTLIPASAPTGLALFDPVSSPGADDTPIIQVSGVQSGDVVYLYTDASCTTMVGNTTASGVIANVTSSALPNGTYDFYATRDNATNTESACSTATVEYEVNISPPSPPTGLTLQNPAVSPSNDDTPTIAVAGTDSGATVKLYTDASCTTEVGSTIALGDPTNVTSSPLADGTYTFYAEQTLGGLDSGCSTANVTYEYDAGSTQPDPPTSLTLIDPATSPDADTTPTIRVAGVTNGYTVRLYSDSGCTSQVASGVSTGTTIDLTTSALGIGSHLIYANQDDLTPETSNCSTAFVIYEVTSDIQLDDFESGLGNWIQGTGDQRDWTLNSGTTPSNGVGPDSGYGGAGQYIYTEASSPVAANDEFHLISNSLDAGANNLAVSFKWNKRGDNMGDLHLEVSTDGGTSWDTPIWSHLGRDVAQGGTHVWNSAAVDLCGLGYNSGNIMMRFRGVMPGSGNVWNSDIALDDVRVYASSCAPTPTVTLANASGTVTGGNASSYPVSGTCSDNGGTILISGHGTGSTTCSGNTWSTNVDFSGAADGPVDILVQHIFAGAQGLAFGTYTKDTTNLFDDNFDLGLGNWINVAGDNHDWTVNSGDTPSSGVGPSSDAGGSGQYIYTEASAPVAVSETFYIELPYDIDAAGNQIAIDFAYNKRGDTMGDLYLEVSTDGGTTWDAPIWSHIGVDVARNAADIWRTQSVDICALGYNTGTARLRFRAVMPASGTVWNSDIALDNIVISNDDCL